MEKGTWKRLSKTVRRKEFLQEQLEEGNLRRCLNYWDLVGLGLGSSLGIGLFILLGSVGLNVAGPSVILSFLLAAVAALFAGLCYAELSARVPRAGSAYIYSYVTVGEVVAFIVGWNMILEGLFGTASIARGLSSYIDSLSNGTMSSWYQATMPLSTGTFFSTYFDLLAFMMVLVLGVFLAVGVKESTRVNTVFAGINMVLILFIVVTGAIRANFGNWRISSIDVPSPQYGDGGFFPYGIRGTLEGAAICFYGFVGFDVISASSEEARKPRRHVPQAIITVIAVAFIAYSAVALVITLMVPYYEFDSLDAVSQAFLYVGMDWARWVVSTGAVFAISSCLFGAMFPLPRLLYAMSSDGLLVRCLSQLSSRKAPVVATLLSACVIALLAAITELNQLILMVCIGTLLSYTVVAVCVVLLRYSSEHMPHISNSYFKQIFGWGPGVQMCSNVSSKVVGTALLLFIGVSITTAAVVVYVAQPLIPVVTLNTVALLLLVVVMLQPQAKDELVFKTPLVPIIPCLSIYINIHLMMLVNVQTWIRVGIWILIGIPVYLTCICCYKRNQKENELSNKNGTYPVQIVVESPTPTGTIKSSAANYGDEQLDKETETEIKENRNTGLSKNEEIFTQQAILEDNEEKEAKIIDLLDQVLQAEEDSYAEVISLKEEQEDTETELNDPIPHRKSLSDLSDAGSDASQGIQVLSKYDVVAQVHREDLPRLSEEEEKSDKGSDELQSNDQNENDLYESADEEVTAFNIDSETNSQTDESGYSDTIDRHPSNYSVEHTREKEATPNIPTPPPLDESFFSNYFLKSFTIPLPSKQKSIDDEQEIKPRESIKSNGSQDESTIVFGSARQMSFMSKLNSIFQNKISAPEENDQIKRSNSTGDMMDTSTFTMNRERPSIFHNLNKELLSLSSAPHLRPVKIIENRAEINEINNNNDDKDDSTLSREDLKSKLENILAGGPKLLKTRMMKSNPPTPEEAYQTDTSSSESVQKIPKIEKNDTLKRQKDKFSAVLNSFRLSLNKDDDI